MVKYSQMATIENPHHVPHQDPHHDLQTDSLNGDVNRNDARDHQQQSPRKRNDSLPQNQRTPTTFNDYHIEYHTKFRFGWLSAAPRCLQIFNNAKFFLVCACVGALAEGLIVTGISYSVLTSIEKQFGLSSSQLATFTSCYEIVFGICSVFIGFFGRMHKPRFLAIGLLLMVIGSVLLALPKFVIGPYTAGVSRVSDYCNLGNTTSHTLNCNKPNVDWQYKFIFVLGYVILGIGATPLFVLVPSHLVEVTERGRGDFYMGIFYCFASIGPALGFIIAMPTLNTWVDFVQPKSSSLTPTDFNWVGAWWIGYFVGAIVCLIPVIPLSCIPKEFPNTAGLRTLKRQHRDSVVEDSDLIGSGIRAVWPRTKALLVNIPYIFVTLAMSSESLAIGGFATFLPKFINVNFNINTSDAALYTGILVIPGAAVGIFLGGYVIKRFSMNCQQIIKCCAIMAFISAMLCLFALVGCEGRKVEGMTTTSKDHNFTTACNRGCFCNEQVYKPICTVADQKTYYSPCHAGCYNGHSINKVFENCTCFEKNVTRGTLGRCSKKCVLFPLFAVGFVLLMFFTFMNNVPLLSATLRVVSESQGSYALGFQSTIVRFIGFIPAPIMYGAAVDTSCVLWQRDGCTGKSTNCLEYNHAHLRYYMMALSIATKFISFIFVMLAYKFYKLPDNAEPTNQPAVIYSDADVVIANQNVTVGL